MNTYIFADSKGTLYYCEFKNRDEAMRFAYKAGFSFIGAY